MSVLLLYHLFTAHSLWWAPFFAWFLMVSAWARRLPILWAVLPVAVMVVVEQIAFGSSHFLGMLINRFGGESYSVTLPTPHAMPMHPMAHMTPGHFLLNPQLWMGFAVAAVFLAVAVRLRRYRGPI
jgi:ABC-2 type transport system permease protein